MSYLYTRVDFAGFRDAFARLGRGDHFSSGALSALFEHFEISSEISIELDPIAICCDWVEYGSATDAAEAQGLDASDASDAMRRLRDHTTVVVASSGGVLVAF